MSTADNKLSSKDATTFKKLVKCYEEKQYKNGLRHAKQILSNSKCSPIHAESLAYKGMCLSVIGRAEEALESVKAAVKTDLKCSLAWRAYALVLRESKKYEESVKCFKNSMKIERNNLDNLRDLSVLQIHLRDLEGWKESRHAIYQIKPTQRNLVAVAMSYHLTGDFDTALNMLDNLNKSKENVNKELVGELMKKMFNKKEAYDYENSELILYHNMVIR